MPLNILRYGNRALRGKAAPVKEFDEKFRRLVAEMKETMLEGDGIGLAAPQVGVPLRFFIVGIPRDPKQHDGDIDWYVIANPIFVEKSREQIVMEEGCLSFPGLYIEVNRPKQVTIEYQDEFGAHQRLTADTYLARITQHEADHLDGVLYIDRVSALKRSLLRRKLKELQVK